MRGADREPPVGGALLSLYCGSRWQFPPVSGLADAKDEGQILVQLAEIESWQVKSSCWKNLTMHFPAPSTYNKLFLCFSFFMLEASPPHTYFNTSTHRFQPTHAWACAIIREINCSGHTHAHWTWYALELFINQDYIWDGAKALVWTELETY